VTIQFYSVAADQETVEEARDAAIQARDNTQAAVDAARQAQQAAEEVNTIVNSTLTVSAGVVQDANGTVLTAARAAQMAAQANSQKLDNISNALNQVQNNIQQVQQSVQNITQNMPPVLNRISGLNGANATSSGTLQVIVDASNVTQYRYRIDNGGWSAWLPFSDNVVTVPIPRGVHTLTIQVANGPVGTPGPAASASMQVIGL